MKKVALFLLGTFVAVSLGCGGGDQGGVKEKQAKKAEPKTEQVVQAPATPGQNLIPDPEFKDLKKAWILVKKPYYDNQATIEVMDDTLPTGEAVKALCVTTTGDVPVYSDKISIDPNKAYRFSLWIKHDPTKEGSRWFGLLAYDAQGKILPVIKADGTPQPNPYFWYGNRFSDNQWHQFIGYVLPTNAGDGWRVPKDAAPGNFRLPSDATQVSFRFLNVYNKGTQVKACFAQPKIEEVDLDELTK